LEVFVVPELVRLADMVGMVLAGQLVADMDLMAG
jgi:hypothetical protein